MTFCLSDFVSYPVRYGIDPETGAYTAYFRDFDSSTCDDDPNGIRDTAKDWLTLAGQTYPRNHAAIPPASLPQADEELIELSPTLALKFVLRNAMTAKNLRPSDLARILGMSSQAVNGLLDVYREGTRFDALYRAIRACGAEITISSPAKH